jgi:predicted RNA-binding Zn ribbon-like protein
MAGEATRGVTRNLMTAYHTVMSTRDLPPDLALPLRSGEPWWYFLGGRPSLDLVNTLRERWDRRVETLVTPADLGRWLVRVGVLPAPPPRVSRAALDEARALREAIDACATGERAPRAAVAVIDAALAPGPKPRLAVASDGVPALGEAPPGDPVRAALAAIALDAATMLGTPAQASRVRICASASCSARFYDRSPAGGRRWCSMQACGNTAKARRHRARAGATPSRPTETT